MRKDRTDQPVVKHKSHYEQVWTQSDFKDHEVLFQEMLTEYRDIRKKNGDDAILARREWLRRKKAVKIKGNDVSMNPELYPIYSSMFDKFTEWLSFHEKPNPAEVESLEKMKEQIADEITINDIPL